MHRLVYMAVHVSPGADLCEVILHYIPDDAKLIKVAPPPFCTKRLLEAYLYIGDEVSMPRWGQELVCKPAGGRDCQRVQAGQPCS